MSQIDRAAKKAVATTSYAWGRDRMNETHRKGRRGAKKVRRRAGRRVSRIGSTLESLFVELGESGQVRALTARKLRDAGETT